MGDIRVRKIKLTAMSVRDRRALVEREVHVYPRQRVAVRRKTPSWSARPEIRVTGQEKSWPPPSDHES